MLCCWYISWVKDNYACLKLKKKAHTLKEAIAWQTPTPNKFESTVRICSRGMCVRAQNITFNSYNAIQMSPIKWGIDWWAHIDWGGRESCGGTHEYKSEVTEVRPFIHRWWCCRGHLFYYSSTLVVQSKCECSRSENLGNTRRIILCCRWQKIDSNLEWNYTFPARAAVSIHFVPEHAKGLLYMPQAAVAAANTRGSVVYMVGKCQRNGHYLSLPLFKRFNLFLCSNMSCGWVLVRPFCRGKFSWCGPRYAINAHRLVPICNCRELPWIWVRIIGNM